MRRPEIVSKIMLALRNKVPQATTILYGSEARGDARADSDIDLLVLLPKEKISYADRDQVIDALYDIEIESGVAISPYMRSEGQVSLATVISGTRPYNLHKAKFRR